MVKCPVCNEQMRYVGSETWFCGGIERGHQQRYFRDPLGRDPLGVEPVDAIFAAHRTATERADVWRPRLERAATRAANRAERTFTARGTEVARATVQRGARVDELNMEEFPLLVMQRPVTEFHSATTGDAYLDTVIAAISRADISARALGESSTAYRARVEAARIVPLATTLETLEPAPAPALRPLGQRKWTIGDQDAEEDATSKRFAGLELD